MHSAAGIALVFLALSHSTVLAADRRHLDPSETYRVPVGDAPTRGARAALVTIIEFSDYRCPYCKRVQDTLAALSSLFPGQLRFVFRNNPLDPVDGSLAAEAAAAAARQGRFWPMHDRLFASRGAVTRSLVEAIATGIGLDMPRFRADLNAPANRANVMEDVAAAEQLGFQSAPVFFINGRPIRGARSISVFVQIIGEELIKANQMVTTGIRPDRVYETIMASGKLQGGAEPVEEDGYGAPPLSPQFRYRVGTGLAGHAKGPADALVTIVEFSDFECGFCARSAEPLQALLQRYGADLRLAYRHSPLRMHANAKLAAEAAVSAANMGKFWPFHDLLFAHRGKLTRPVLEQLAAQAGLDMDTFRAALDDRRHQSEVAADSAIAAALGVNGTPTFFVNGTPVVGAASEERLSQIIDIKMVQARDLVKHGVPRADVYQQVVRPLE